jgi:uncharacterized UBP type Zn finger protein
LFYEKCEKYGNMRQHDSHEVFLDLLNILRKEMKVVQESLYKFKHLEKPLKLFQDGIDGFTVIDELFKLQYLHDFTCSKCNHEIKKYVTEFGFYLDYKPHLFDSIRSMFVEETIPDYTCEKCKEQCDLIKKTKLIHFPPYLAICVKRLPFQQFKFLPEIIHVNKKQYKLYAFSSHSGMSMNSGHYVAHVLNNEWKFKNDEQNVSCEKPTVSLAYMIFYSSV